MEVKYIDHMGSDLTVVNAARVSFAKRKESLDDKDIRLIRYLAKHGHWTPFAHPQITLKLKVPFFVANQIKKHQVGFVVNEVSRRYVDTPPAYYEPEWRVRAENVKQGSGGPYPDSLPESHYKRVRNVCDEVYEELLERGVAPEQARMVLPLSTYTEFWMTGSLYGWANLYNLRSKPDTQVETQEVADMIKDEVQQVYPHSWKALTNV